MSNGPDRQLLVFEKALPKLSEASPATPVALRIDCDETV
jgi:hypothetical protein